MSVASAAFLSAGAFAAAGDESRVDNVKWIADITTQTITGTLVVTDINGNLLQAGHAFDLGVVEEDLTFAQNYASQAILQARTWTDSTTDGVQGKVEAGEIAATTTNATWVINSAKYDVISGGTITSTGVVPTVYVNGTAATLGSDAATGKGEIAVTLEQSTAPTVSAENVSKAVVTLSISAKEDA